ncbi:MAG: hypothetical protein AB1765_06520 [Candidatus Hydrogenedentota bacterium]
MQEIKIICPCCKTELYIDKETEAILKYEQPKKPGPSLKEMLEYEKKKVDKRQEIFSKEMEKQKRKKDILDKKFKKAFSEFKDDGKRPQTPFDWE